MSLKEQTSIPKNKISRAGRLAQTGVKVGVNYLKYKTKAMMGDDDKSEFHEVTAKQTYETFSELKGGPLKLAQMLSMDRNLIPDQYADQFSQAQYKAPALTYPLVVNTFQKELSKHPTELFDSFTNKAVSAASIGQVHQATLGDKTFAIKIQYPGVASSLKSDLAIVKPIAMRLFQLDSKSLDPYIKEVEERLLEETNYDIELERSQFLAEQSKHLKHTHFPNFHPEFSSQRILTMDWVEGEQLDTYAESDANDAMKQQIAQALWDFYHHQIHTLKLFHADPHPGNFKVHNDELWVLDFGCTKGLEERFYCDYFGLMQPDVLLHDAKFRAVLRKLGLLLDSDSPREADKLTGIFKESVALLSKPFFEETFDFGDKTYFDSLAAFGERTRNDSELNKLNTSRGNANALYLNRTYFGLYHLVGSLNGRIKAELPTIP
ncbi:ABC1 kinase family protein [Rubritalea marina]|uniref:ABC1 kinase family protein n=1 Tax=Rubritalea marina TaxID=361055 RepID=UPI00036B8FFD|nr:lipopolysaccharide core heptose(II) kinase RfaY [Rubritalea marina]